MFSQIRSFFIYRKAKEAFDAEDYDKALALFDKVRHVAVKDIRPYLYIGITHSRMGAYEKALGYFQKIIALDPKNKLCLKSLVYNYEKNNQFEEALKTLDALVEQDASFAYLNKARILFRLDTDRAIEAYQKVIEIGLADANIMGNIALLYAKNKNEDKAENYYQKALSLEPKNYSVLNNFAYLKSCQLKFEEALVMLDLSIKEKNDYSYAYCNRGYCHMKINRLDDAISDLNKAIDLDNENAYAYRSRALYYIKMNEIKLALNDLLTAKMNGFEKMYGNEVDKLIAKYSM